MPITNEDIVSSLVAYYQRTGVDMTALLGDPTWHDLKIADKIEAVKKYAAEIHNGSGNELTSSEKSRIKTDAVMNAWPVLPAVLTLAAQNQIMHVLPGVKAKTLMGVGLGGIAIGLGVGAINAYVQANQAQKHRQALRANLERVVRDPTNTNAIGVLATSNVRSHQFSSKDAILGRIKGELNEFFHPGDFVHKNFNERMNIEADFARKLTDLQANFQTGSN